MRKKKKEYILLQKIIFTSYVFTIYMLGTNIPLYGVDISKFIENNVNLDSFLIHTIGGDLNQCSIFNLGVFPYMISSLLVQIIYAFKSQEAKKRIFVKKRNSLTLIITLIISCIQAFVHLGSLSFIREIDILGYLMVFWEMVAGSMVIVFLCSRNKKYGLGGQSIIILANILSSIVISMNGVPIKKITIPLILSVFIVVIIILMENTEFRIPLQRISIHNIYADKNYLAIKFNPIGVMPVMFTSAFFLLPQIMVKLALYFKPDSRVLLWWQEQLSLTKVMGIIVYLIILFLLTVSFSLLFINPKDITEQFLKSGDSFLDIHMGNDTRKYLKYVMLSISTFSAVIMGLCLGIPLYLQYIGRMEGILNILPSSTMMLTGVICSFIREMKAINDLESYKSFI